LYGGSGLGLVICRLLTEMMGGDITIESEGLGYGSTCCFSIAVHASTESTVNPLSPEKQRLFAGKHILAVDPNATSADALKFLAGKVCFEFFILLLFVLMFADWRACAAGRKCGASTAACYSDARELDPRCLCVVRTARHGTRCLCGRDEGARAVGRITALCGYEADQPAQALLAQCVSVHADQAYQAVCRAECALQNRRP
jgi:hypothetical protein